MKRILLAAAACLTTAAPALAAPGDMSVAAFLTKADALKAKGAMAMFSPDLKVLQGEGKAAGDAYRARLKAERAAGRPSSCPPANARISSDELLAHLRTYPAAARPRTSIKQAMADYFSRKYPCR
ncbi:MAG: hypothetical protein J0M19_07220 [Sphingomonadales bacterium]|nr:hypothetical protein [Sphingomonadales bacterium]